MAAAINPTENAGVGAKFGVNAIPSLMVAIDQATGNPYPLTRDASSGGLVVAPEGAVPTNFVGNPVSVTNANIPLCIARPTRTGLLIQNQDAVNAVGVSDSAADTYAQCPIILQPGQSLGANIGGAATKAWNAITGGVWTVIVGVTECY